MLTQASNRRTSPSVVQEVDPIKRAIARLAPGQAIQVYWQATSEPARHAGRIQQVSGNQVTIRLAGAVGADGPSVRAEVMLLVATTNGIYSLRGRVLSSHAPSSRLWVHIIAVRGRVQRRRWPRVPVTLPLLTAVVLPAEGSLFDSSDQSPAPARPEHNPDSPGEDRPDPIDEPIQIRLLDLSARGAAFTSNVRLHPSQRLHLVLPLDEAAPLTLHLRVLACNVAPGEAAAEAFRAHGCFLELTPAAQQRLRDYTWEVLGALGLVLE